MPLGLSSKHHKTEIRRYKGFVEKAARGTLEAIRRGECALAYTRMWEAENLLGGLESHLVSIADSAQRKADTKVAMDARRSLLHARNSFGKKCVR